MFITNNHAFFTCGEKNILTNIKNSQNIMNTVVVIVVLLLIINSRFQPGDFSTGSTTAPMVCNIIIVIKLKRCVKVVSITVFPFVFLHCIIINWIKKTERMNQTRYIANIKSKY